MDLLKRQIEMLEKARKKACTSCCSCVNFLVKITFNLRLIDVAKILGLLLFNLRLLFSQHLKNGNQSKNRLSC